MPLNFVGSKIWVLKATILHGPMVGLQMQMFNYVLIGLLVQNLCCCNLLIVKLYMVEDLVHIILH